VVEKFGSQSARIAAADPSVNFLQPPSTSVHVAAPSDLSGPSLARGFGKLGKDAHNKKLLEFLIKLLLAVNCCIFAQSDLKSLNPNVAVVSSGFSPPILKSDQPGRVFVRPD
jgi:hypothetical protein